MATLEQDGLPRTRELGRLRQDAHSESPAGPFTATALGPPQTPESHPPGKGLRETVLKRSPSNPDAHRPQ